VIKIHTLLLHNGKQPKGKIIHHKNSSSVTIRKFGQENIRGMHCDLIIIVGCDKLIKSGRYKEYFENFLYPAISFNNGKIIEIKKAEWYD